MPRICNVLVVEDHDGVRALLGDVLEREGYRFTLVGSGAGMRAHLEAEEFDIVVIDVSLRGEDGFALAAEAAEEGCGVILTTGDQRRFEAVRGSGHRFVLKPFMIDQLLQTIDEVLREIAAKCVRRRRRASVV